MSPSFGQMVYESIRCLQLMDLIEMEFIDDHQRESLSLR
jgi:hypothetical protein